MPTHSTHKPVTQPDDPLAITSMVLGVVGFTGLGLITGIPAIILASIALVRKSPGRNLSLVGLITGIASTLMSIIAILFFILLIWVAASQPDYGASPTPMPAPVEPYSHSRI